MAATSSPVFATTEVVGVRLSAFFAPVAATSSPVFATTEVVGVTLSTFFATVDVTSSPVFATTEAPVPDAEFLVALEVGTLSMFDIALRCALVIPVLVVLVTVLVAVEVAGANILSTPNSFAIPGWDFSRDLINDFWPAAGRSFILSNAVFLT